MNESVKRLVLFAALLVLILTAGLVAQTATADAPQAKKTDEATPATVAPALSPTAPTGACESGAQDGCVLKHKQTGSGCMEKWFPAQAVANGWDDGPCPATPAPSATPVPATSTRPAPTSTRPAPTSTRPAPTSTRPAPTSTRPAPTTVASPTVHVITSPTPTVHVIASATPTTVASNTPTIQPSPTPVVVNSPTPVAQFSPTPVAICLTCQWQVEQELTIVGTTMTYEFLNSWSESIMVGVDVKINGEMVTADEKLVKAGDVARMVLSLPCDKHGQLTLKANANKLDGVNLFSQLSVFNY